MAEIRAFDGQAWSAPDDGPWTTFIVSPLPFNHPPSLTPSSLTMAPASSVALSSLFAVSDADGDSMTKYQLWDGNADPNSGYFVINGVAQAARTVIEITASQLAQTSFVAGQLRDGLQIRAFDGRDWSAPDNGAGRPWSSPRWCPA